MRSSRNTLCIVDSELVSYETATLTSANHYSLTTLYRGLYGTAIAAHSSGAPFARLDSAVFEYDLPAQYVGKTLYIKLQSFNVFGGGVQELSTCAAYTYTPTGVAVDHPVARAMLVGSSDGFRPGHASGRHAGRLRRAVHLCRSNWMSISARHRRRISE